MTSSSSSSSFIYLRTKAVS